MGARISQVKKGPSELEEDTLISLPTNEKLDKKLVCPLITIYLYDMTSIPEHV